MKKRFSVERFFDNYQKLKSKKKHSKEELRELEAYEQIIADCCRDKLKTGRPTLRLNENQKRECHKLIKNVSTKRESCYLLKKKFPKLSWGDIALIVQSSGKGESDGEMMAMLAAKDYAKLNNLEWPIK